MDPKEIGGREEGEIDSVHLAQDRDKCLAVVNTVMNIRFA